MKKMQFNLMGKAAVSGLALAVACTLFTACSDDKISPDDPTVVGDGEETVAMTNITDQSILSQYVVNLKKKSKIRSRAVTEVTIDTTFPTTLTEMPDVDIDWNNLPTAVLANYSSADAYQAAAATGVVVGSDGSCLYYNYGDLTIYVPSGTTFTLNQLMTGSKPGKITVYVQEGATFKTSNYSSAGGGEVVVYNWGTIELNSYGTIGAGVTIYNANKVTSTGTLTLTGGAQFYAFNGMDIANIYPGCNDNSTGALLYVKGDLKVSGIYKQQTGCDVVVTGDLTAPSYEMQGGEAYVKGSVEIDGLVNIAGAKLVTLGNISGKYLNLQGTTWTGTTLYSYLYVGGYADFCNDSKQTSKIGYAYMVVVDGVEFYDVQIINFSYVDTGCNMYVEMELNLTTGEFLKSLYIKATTITFSSSASIELLNGGFIDCELLSLNNSDTNSIYCPDGYAFIYTDHVVTNYLQLATFDGVYVTSPLWNYGSWDTSVNYFDAPNQWSAGITTIPEEYKSIYFNTVSKEENVSSSSKSCAEYTFNPSSDPDDEDPIIPGIDPLDPISYILPTHTHPISATCVAVNGNEAYVSWHLRGGNIWGCLEKFSIGLDSDGCDEVKIDAWMETPAWLGYDSSWLDGGNHYAVSGDEVKSIKEADTTNAENDAYDFNHLIYDSSNGYLITVGDHPKKGGFVGRVNTAKMIQDGNVDIMSVRQMGKETNSKLTAGGSGNCVVRQDDELWMTSRGGFVKFPYADNGALFSVVAQRDITALATDGSVKHIAISSDGSKAATIELNYNGKDANTTYDWWDDETTAIPATLRIWDLSNGWDISSAPAGTAVDAFSPIYGKDVLQYDSDGTIWSCQGHNGVAHYDANGKEIGRVNVDSWLRSNWNRVSYTDPDLKDAIMEDVMGSAANGLYVDNKYLYIANGAAGVWVYEKSAIQGDYTGDPLTYYFNPRGGYDYYEGYKDYTTDKIGCSANYITVMETGGRRYLICAYGRSGLIVFNITDGWTSGFVKTDTSY